METLTSLSGLVLALIASGFFSGSEMAFTALGHSRVLLWQRERRLGASLTAAWHARPDSLLITILVGNNLANISCTAFATLLGIKFGWPDWGVLIGVTLLLTIGGETLPKALFREIHHRVFPALAVPLRVINLILWPLVAPISLLFRSLPSRGESDLLQMRAHLHSLTEELGRSGALGKRESRMIRRALDLRERRLGELMTPRTDLLALAEDASLRDAADLIMKSGKSSLPLVRSDLDHIVGYITARDLFQQPLSLKEIRRDPLFVPESMKARDLLTAFGRGQARLAIVLDEYGGTAGLLTLEDLLENLVGAIDDEYDKFRRDLIPLADGRWFTSSRFKLDLFTERTGVKLPAEDADTLGGWVVERLGRIPCEGERLHLPPLHVSIVSASPRHLRHVIVQLGKPQSGDESPKL